MSGGQLGALLGNMGGYGNLGGFGPSAFPYGLAPQSPQGSGGATARNFAQGPLNSTLAYGTLPPNAFSGLPPGGVQNTTMPFFPGGPPPGFGGGFGGGSGSPFGYPGQFGYGWAPPFNVSPQSQGAYSPQYPQLYGGPWNQATQMMAGPGYQPQQQISSLFGSPAATAPPLPPALAPGSNPPLTGSMPLPVGFLPGYGGNGNVSAQLSPWSLR